MEGHAKKCVERYCELANKTTQQLHKVSTACVDDHHFKEEELKSVGELSKVCSQIVLKCLYLARIGRPDILWSVHKLARSITKWTKAWPGGKESPRHELNRRRRTREGPERACVQTALVHEWHMQGEKGELTSCRGTVQFAWQRTSSWTQRRKSAGCPQG